MVLAAVGLAVYALADCASSDSNERGGAPKWLWYLIIVVLPLFGPLAWILSRRSRTTRVAGTGSRPARGAQRRGPVAPDDDPDFLWKLEQERRRRERESGGGTPTGDRTDDAPSGPGSDDAAAGGAPSDGPAGAGDEPDERPTDDDRPTSGGLA